MDAYPGPVTLHQRRRPLVALLLGSIVWTVLFLALAVVGLPADVDPDFDRNSQVLMGLIFGAVGVFGILLTAYRLRRPYALTLTVEGFDVTGSGVDSYLWKRVENSGSSSTRTD